MDEDNREEDQLLTAVIPSLSLSSFYSDRQAQLRTMARMKKMSQLA